MKLTPLDIRHKEFKRGMRGYTDVEVDEFLDEVADEYERLYKENIDTKERVVALVETVAGYKRLEETLQNTLVTAQGSAEELKRKVAKEAEIVLHEAELKARQMVHEANAEKQAIEQSLTRIKVAEQDCRVKFRQLLEGYLRRLDEATPPQPSAVKDAALPDLAHHAEAIMEAIAREAPVATRAEVAPSTPVAPRAVEAPVADEAAAVPLDVKTQTDPADVVLRVPVAPTEPGPGAAEQAPERERILFGESDDLLDDIDSGVNENEFKW